MCEGLEHRRVAGLGPWDPGTLGNSEAVVSGSEGGYPVWI